LDKSRRGERKRERRKRKRRADTEKEIKERVEILQYQF